MGDNKHDEQDRFKEYLEALEGNRPQTTLFAVLKDAGIDLPNPDDIPEHEMHDTLWRVIHALWDHGVILYCTDHLSDRELYTLLWTELLLEDHPVVPDGFPVTTHLDVLGGWSEDDIEVFLRYYADEDDRKTWREEFGKTLPEHVDPPHERDRFLPGH
jgi:hypothetical protein